MFRLIDARKSAILNLK